MQGDLIDPPSLLRACQSVDRVFAAAHSILGRGQYKSEAVDDAGHRALIDAAKAAGVARFVYTSILGVAPHHPVDFWRTKYHIEEYLKASGMSYTILRPSSFMELHAHLLNGKSILENGKTRMLGKGTKLRNFVAARDVAQLAVRALLDPKLNNRTIDIGGPQNLTNNHVAELYGKIAGVTPKISYISRIMYLGSLPEDAFSETFDPAILLAEFPIQLTTLEEFIHDRIAEAKHI
jgi:NADH dehydrogenase